MVRGEITFRQAMADTRSKRRHLLLGNGFSISGYCGFAYTSLLAEMTRRNRSVADFFGSTDVQDVEQGMALAEPEMRKDIRRCFIETISESHPLRGQLSMAERENCAKFLSGFLGPPGRHSSRRGRVFTTNYDLLLYWIVVEHEKPLRAWDGFGGDHLWHSEWDRVPLIHYLHGALHLYEAREPSRHPIRRLTSQGVFTPTLVEVIDTWMAKGNFPLVVAECGPKAKAEKVIGNRYLNAAKDAFLDACDIEEDALFTFGHRLSAVDKHLTNAIGKGSISSIYVSVFDEADEAWLGKLTEEWAALRDQRNKPRLHVRYFDARQAPVWR